MPEDLPPDDGTLFALARAARARTGSAQGAAVRDATGRCYVAVDLTLPSLQLSALQAAVAAAVASGVDGLESALVVASGSTRPDPVEVAAVRDVGGGGVRIVVVDGLGHVRWRGLT